MTEVLLVNPSWERYVSRQGKRYNRYWPPLDLLSCAGLLEREGARCTLQDLRVGGPRELPLDRFDFIFVTSSALDRWQCPNLDLEFFAEQIRSLPQDRTFVLGAHGTMDPDAVARATGKAGIVREEPEMPVLQIVRGRPKAEIPGLSFLENGKWIHNPSETPPPLDDLALPAYHLVDTARYGYELLGDNFALLETSRGCPHACTYCYLGMYPKYRLKSPQRVVEEVRALLESTTTRNIYFIDLEFAIHRRHCEALLDALIESGMKFSWCCQTRADSVDLPLLQKMKRSGCRLIHYGVEAGSDRIMAMVNKRLEPQAIRDAIQLTRRAGMNSACFFMMGFPTETEAEIRNTWRFAQELNPTFASFHIATPYPGTEMYSGFQTQREGPFIEESYRQALPLQRLKELEREAYLQYYLRPSYLLSRLATRPSQSWQQMRLFWNFFSAA